MCAEVTEKPAQGKISSQSGDRRPGVTIFIGFLNGFSLLLIAMWLGAAIFFSASVAPSVFAVLRAFHLPNANEIAGSIVTRTLAVINVSGFLISLSLVLVALFSSKLTGKRVLAIEVAALLIIAITTGVGHWVITARMRALRAAMITIDQVASDDPLRVAFHNLHGYSVALLGIAMIAALVAFLVIAHRTSLHS
jgi:uncharacterized protein DUF4149